MTMTRRDVTSIGSFLAATSSLVPLGASAACSAERSPADAQSDCQAEHLFNGAYQGECLEQIGFPLGGIGAGMMCLDGAGRLTQVSVRNRPELTFAPNLFAAIAIRGSRKFARVLEGPIARRKLHPSWTSDFEEFRATTLGLPRFSRASFEARFPFANVTLEDHSLPLRVKLSGWSPFIPNDADNSSLPVIGLEYRVWNTDTVPLEAVFSFNAENFLAEPRDLLNLKHDRKDRIEPLAGGFILYGPGSTEAPWNEGRLAVWLDEPHACVNHAWIEGGGLYIHADALKSLWSDIEAGAIVERAPKPESSVPGASVQLPFTLLPGDTRSISVRIAWYVPGSNTFAPTRGFQGGKIVLYSTAPDTYKPWYAGRFAHLAELVDYWQQHYSVLQGDSARFTHALYDSTVPPELLEAVATNLCVLKSPALLRQIDGRLFGWDGVMLAQAEGGEGSAPHTRNYAQSIAHLFPALERTVCETQFGDDQNEDGYSYGGSTLPIRSRASEPPGPAAADGQLGAIITAYRNWRIYGDTAWIRTWWPRIRKSLDFCIRTWDPEHRGWVEEPHATTYDVTFWGPGMCTSIYLGALQAAVAIGRALGVEVELYSTLLSRGRERMETELFNGEYFVQKIKWHGLRARFAPEHDEFADVIAPSAEQLQLLQREGPKYQYGPGCFADGVLGEWLSYVSGMEPVLDRAKVRLHLAAVHRYNFKHDLSGHANIARHALANGREAGLLLCTWPRGGEPRWPLFYAGEVWTGIEHEVASHLISVGLVSEGLEIVRACRARYDGTTRNPFSEIEAAEWYVRSMSSYALLQAFTGARFDAVERVLYLKPVIRGDFRCFFSTATGFGMIGVKNGAPFVEVVSGHIPYSRIEYTSA